MKRERVACAVRSRAAPTAPAYTAPAYAVASATVLTALRAHGAADKNLLLA